MKLSTWMATTAVALLTAAAQAAFVPGNLVVVQAGDGSASLSGNATACFLKEFTTTGSSVSALAMPTALSGGQYPLTLSGSASSEGALSLSSNGQYLTMAGYGVIPGTLTPQTSTPTAVPRVVGRIDLTGNIDTTTALTDAYSGSNIRGAVSQDGTTIYTFGNGGSGQGATAGVRSTTLGSSTTTQINSTTTNMRVANIFNNQMYVSAASGTYLGVGTLGTGMPPATGSVPTLLPGMPTSGTHSSYDFWFKDASTLYVADDGSAANSGGIQKWTFNGSTWALAYTLLNTGTTTTPVRGLTGTLDGSGNAVLFATTAATSANLLITVTDTGSGATATTLATAPASTAFRGVEFLPIPEPTTLSLLAIGALALIRRR